MRLFFIRHFLFIFTTGKFLSEVRGDCGGTADVLGERSGSVWLSFPTGLNSKTFTNETFSNSSETWENVTCTWILNTQENQTVRIDVFHVDQDTKLRIKFSNKTIFTEEDGTFFIGSGRTTVEWSWTNGTRAPRKLHLRWTTSGNGHEPAQVPYTHSDNDPVSPSPDTRSRVTRAPDILGSSSASPVVYTLWGMSVREGGGVSVSDDKNGPLIPQEGSHNGQEKAGATIFDLADTVTHTDTHTRTTLSHTHAKTHTVTQTAPTSALSNDKTKLPQVSAHTLAGHYDVAMATGAYFNREPDNAYTVPQTKALTNRSPAIDSHKQTDTKIYSETHNGTKGALLNSAATVASSHTLGQFDSVTDNEASNRVSRVDGLFTVTKGDFSMMTSNDEGISMATTSQPYAASLATTPRNKAQGSAMDQTSHSSRASLPNHDSSYQTQSAFNDSNTVSDSPAVVTQNQTTFSHKDITSQSAASEIPYITPSRQEEPLSEGPTLLPFETHRPNIDVTSRTESDSTVLSVDLTTTQPLHNFHTKHATIFTQTSSTSVHSITDQSGSTDAFSPNANTIISSNPSDLPLNSATLVAGLTEEARNFSPTSHSPNTVSQEMSSAIFPSSFTLPFVTKTPQIKPTGTPDLRVEGLFTTEESLPSKNDQESDTATSYATYPLTTESMTYRQHKKTLHTLNTPHITQVNTAIPQSTDFPQADHSRNDISHANSSQSSVSLGPMIPVSISQSISFETGSMEITHSITSLPKQTESTDPVTSTTVSPVISLSSASSTAGEAVSTSTASQGAKSMTPAANATIMSTQRAKTTTNSNSTLTSTPLSTSGNTPVLQTQFPIAQPGTSTRTLTVSTNSDQSPTGSHKPSTPAFSQMTSLHPFTHKSGKDWSHKGRYYVVEDQPAIIKVETFQVLLQVVLEGNPLSHVDLVEVELYLNRVAGYQGQQVTWHSGAVLQTVVTFHTVEALSWLWRVESFLQVAGLSPLPKKGLFVGGVRVNNITVGGLHNSVCSWFTCPSGFQCVSSEGNASCRSLCHTEYCKHHGICVHHPGQQPLCQCPVGEDFWFMGQRCDLRMTRQRLVGLCFGVLLAVVLLMAFLSYLAVRRFKSMLMQAKVDQTRSSYRRFNHFDELSARFWGRSWPGSEDSLDNPAFTRSDELLHMRALDRTCCYHDDTLSLASTYQDSASHLNTVYPHSSQYRWDLSNYSLADCVVDSGKASDLSVCSWPIEPIQWTPFPLLQQLSRNTAPVKSSRPRSYCEGMELVDMEKSWTA
ncbi:serine-rich adhesin for platelets isoform X2 [Hoplias malabaricus]|uniref:serine-rich adhesin for platelets isoform X2 n=1 Tax=Hoplias malabaricus TaxID=27720 RepID=UPI0034636B30